MNKTVRTNKRLTVQQLREMLAEIPGDFVVSTEGCDCTGPCDGFLIDGRKFTLTRNDSLEGNDDF